MPRGGRRDGAGRPGWKAKAERSTSLDVRHLDRAGVFRGPCGGSGTNGSASISFTAVEGWLTLSYAIGGEARTQQIAITRTPCHYGGTRPWFRCPGGERVAVLYLRAGRFACRHCQGIAYASQSDDVVGRAWRRQRKVEARLGEDEQRPKGMHQTTYERLLEVIDRCEYVKDVYLIAAAARLGLDFD